MKNFCSFNRRRGQSKYSIVMIALFVLALLLIIFSIIYGFHTGFFSYSQWNSKPTHNPIIYSQVIGQSLPSLNTQRTIQVSLNTDNSISNKHWKIRRLDGNQSNLFSWSINDTTICASNKTANLKATDAVNNLFGVVKGNNNLTTAIKQTDYQLITIGGGANTLFIKGCLPINSSASQYLKIGNTSLEASNDGLQSINIDPDGVNLTCSIDKFVNSQFTPIQALWIQGNEWGLNDTYSNGNNETYRITCNSTMNYKTENNAYDYGIMIHNFTETCKSWNNCIFGNGNGTMNVTLISNGWIDPTFIIPDTAITATTNEINNVTIENQFSHLTINPLNTNIVTPSAVTTIAGTYVWGDASNLSAIDNLTYHVDELAQAPGWEIGINFTGVTKPFNNLSTTDWYSGNLGHDINVMLWNYSSSTWVTFYKITDSTNWVNRSAYVEHYADFVSGGLVQMIINHTSSGNPTHDIQIDYASLSYNNPYNSLVGYWNFDRDWSDFVWGNGSRGYINNSLSFESSKSQYVSVPNSASLNFAEGVNFTISLWIKSNQTAAIASYPAFLSKQDKNSQQTGYLMLLHSSTSVGADIELWINDTVAYSCGFSTGVNLADNKWHHIVGMRFGNNLSTYQDGNLINICTGSNKSVNKNIPLIIGSLTTTANYFNGTEDDLAIWNRSLSDTEVASLYARGLQGLGNNITDSSLVAYYPFDDNNGTTLYDVSGNNKNGAMTNYAPTTAYDFSNNNLDGVYTNGAYPNNNGISSIFGAYGLFDGVNDRISLPNSNLTRAVTNFTICSWYKTNSSAIETIYSNYDSGTGCSIPGAECGYVMGLINGRARIYYNVTAQITDNKTTSDNKWHHVCSGSNSTNYYLYVDGILTNMSGAFTPSMKFADNIRIGDLNNAGTETQFFSGSIDEVMYFNSSLTSQQISDIYNNQSARFYPRGEQIMPQIDLEGSNGSNRVLVQAPFQNIMGSNISLKLGEWDSSLGYNETGDPTLRGYWHLDNTTIEQPLIAGKINNSMNYYANSSQAVYLINRPITNYALGFTIEAWFNTTGPSQYQSIFYQYTSTADRVYLYVDATSRAVCMTVGSSGGPCSSVGAYTLNRTAHIVAELVPLGATYNVTLYVNSVQVANAVTTVGFTNGGMPIIGDGSLKGQIDEFRIWNRTLSLTEIQNIYGNESLGQYDPNMNRTGLRVEQHFDNMSGVWTTDTSGNGNNGYLTDSNIKTLDSSGYGNDGTLGAVYNTTGQYAGGMKYTAVGNSVIAINHNFFNNTNTDFPQVTMSAWVKLDSYAAQQVIAGESAGATSQDSTYLLQNGVAAPQFSVKNATANSVLANCPTIPTLNTWYLVTGVYNGTSVICYYNGVKGTPVAYSGLIGSGGTNANFKIGRGNTVNPTSGTIDEVMLWNRSLTDSEIQDLYIKGRAKWNLNDSEQNLTADTTNFPNLGWSMSNNTYNISNATTNILPLFYQYGGANQFYSPILGGFSNQITYNAFFVSEFVPAVTNTTILVNPATPINYGTASNFTCVNNMSLPINLTSNGIEITSQNGLDIVRAGGTYNLVCNATGNSTVSGSEANYTYVINPISKNVTLYINGTHANQTGVYNITKTNISYTVNFGGIALYHDGVFANSLLNQYITLGVGYHNFSGFSAQNENYTQSWDSIFVNITQEDANCSITTSDVVYPNNVSITATCIDGLTLKLNGTTISNPFNQKLNVSQYLVEVFGSDTQNFSNTYMNKTVLVGYGTPPLAVSSSPNPVTIFNNATTTGTGCPNELTCNLFQDSVLVSNPHNENYTSLVGHLMVYNTTGNNNYLSASVFTVLNVLNQTAPTVTTQATCRINKFGYYDPSIPSLDKQCNRDCKQDKFGYSSSSSNMEGSCI